MSSSQLLPVRLQSVLQYYYIYILLLWTRYLYLTKACQQVDWVRHKQSWPMVVVREIEGNGKGLVAIRNISAGAVIFTEDPLIVYKKEVSGYEQLTLPTSISPKSTTLAPQIRLLSVRVSHSLSLGLAYLGSCLSFLQQKQ